jgi:hypothetical protein
MSRSAGGTIHAIFTQPKDRMKSYAIVLSTILLSACGAQPVARPEGEQVSREVRAQCQREAMAMYPVAYKMEAGSLSMKPPRPTTAFDPAPPPPEDTNATARLDQINACVRNAAGKKKPVPDPA